jgi:hypothetical protein
MTQVPIAEGLLTLEPGPPRMLASRCPRCDARAYPVQSGCARCGSVDLETITLSPAGTIWTWSSSRTPTPGRRSTTWPRTGCASTASRSGWDTAGERQVPGAPRVGYAQLYGAPGTAGVTIIST